jgi:hypothetical protein
MCAPSPPAPPNYQAAAQAQGSENRDTALYNSKLNNPNVSNPYGTQTVQYGGFDQAGFDQALARYNAFRPTYDPATGRQTNVTPPQPTREAFTIASHVPTITQTLAPAQQAILDQQNQAKIGLGQLANTGIGSLGQVIGKNVDLSGQPAIPQSGTVNQRVIDAMQSRVMEDYARKRDQSNSDMIAAGLRPGSKGYDDAMQLVQRGENDANQQAVLAGYDQGNKTFGQDTQSRAMSLADYYSARQTPLNEITALMSGSQVTNPYSMPGYAQGANAQGAPLFGATQATGDWNTGLYNAKAAQQGNMMQGLFGLGATGMMAMSDRRLKSNIVRLGEHPLGIGWYEYDIFGHRTQGVMADEVKQVRPDAVVRHPSGYDMVDYGRLA